MSKIVCALVISPFYAIAYGGENIVGNLLRMYYLSNKPLEAVHYFSYFTKNVLGQENLLNCEKITVMQQLGMLFFKH